MTAKYLLSDLLLGQEEEDAVRRVLAVLLLPPGSWLSFPALLHHAVQRVGDGVAVHVRDARLVMGAMRERLVSLLPLEAAAEARRVGLRHAFA